MVGIVWFGVLPVGAVAVGTVQPATRLHSREAAQISAELRELIEALPGITTEVSKAQLSGEYNFTNTATKQPRYQAVFSLVHFEDF